MIGKNICQRSARDIESCTPERKRKKCHFVLETMKILGHTWSSGKISHSSDKVETMLELGPAKTKRGVGAVLGMPSYYRSYYPNLAEATHCSNQILRMDKPDKVKGLPEHTAALQAFKRGLTSKPPLVTANSNKPFLIQTDATANSAAAVSTQLDEDRREHVICYASRKLLSREQPYSSTERECLSIIFVVLKWEQWLYGRKIIVQIDQKPLQRLDLIANHSARFARWNIILQKN